MSNFLISIMSNVFSFMFGIIITECVINPRKEYKKLVEKIDSTINMYCCYYSNPYDLLKEENNVREKSEYSQARDEFRRIASDTKSSINKLPKYMKKAKEKLNNIYPYLIGISNGFFISSKNYNPIKDSKEFEKIIKQELGIK